MPKKLDSKVAEKVMLKAGLLPLEPYKKSVANWKCQCQKCGKITYPSHHQIKNGNGGCSRCSGQEKLTLEQVTEIVERRGGKLKSTKYVNVDSTLEFECSKGHRFENTFSHIKNRDQWCPTCNKGSKSEEIARTTFEQLFGFKFPKYRPVWLRNSRGYRMEIDGYCKELEIGFEYQGRQHFDLALYGNDIKKRKADDKLKAKLCSENGIALFILDHKMEYQDFPKYIEKQAKKLDVKLASNFRKIEVDIYKAYIRNDRIIELQNLLRNRNIMVLSPKFLGSNKKVELHCLVCDHKWTALGNAFFNSRSVAGCNNCARKNAGARNKLNIKHLQEFAKLYGGELLSKEYVESEYDYLWKCSAGHTFEKRFSNMKHRKQFCSKCEGRKVRKGKFR